MSQPFVAEIRVFCGNFAPRGWAFCNGQILPISSNTALFSLLGTTYGGDGKSTFALPDLRGRVPVHFSQGPGLSNYDLGEQGGVESLSLLQSEMPSHNHLVNCNSASIQAGHGTKADPAGNFPATQSAGTGIYETSNNGNTMHVLTTGAAGGGQAHDNHQPYLTVNYIIALQGVFPPRS